MRTAASTAEQKQTRAAGKGCATIFFFIFLAAGLFFAFLLGREVLRSAATRGWQKTACTIVESNVLPPRDSEGRYTLSVRYRYHFDGRRYESADYSVQPKQSIDYAEIQRLVERYLAGAKATCYVDSSNPSRAVLKHGSLLLALGLLLPLVFVVIGGGGIYFTWRRAAESRASTAVSDSGAQVTRERFAIALFALFLVAGTGMAFPLLLKPLRIFISSANWVETRCAIVSSEVLSSTDSDGTSYLADVLYEYRFRGRTYRSNRVHAVRVWSSGYRGKAETVARYPAGGETVCLVNPRDPHEALLDRALHLSILVGLVPILFIGVGSWGVLYFSRRSAEARQHDVAVAEGTRVLKTKRSRFVGFLGISIFAVAWNGFIAAFVWHIAGEWQRGRAPWGLSLFALPFVAFGVLLAAGALSSLMALFSPRLRLVLTPGAVSLGEGAQLEWQVNRGSGGFERLRLFLEGREEADYRRGTMSYTDKARFAEIPLLDATNRLEIGTGCVRLELPHDLVPTFKSANNRIVWSLHAVGTVRLWPDVNEEFEVAVLPPRS